MTDRIEAIRARWEKATPGPWALDPSLWSPPGWDDDMHYRRVVHGEPNKVSGIREPLFSTNGAPDGTVQSRQNHRDAAAVAAAPEDVAWLLSEVDRLRIQLDRLTLRFMGAPVAPDAEPTEWVWSLDDVAQGDGHVWHRVGDGSHPWASGTGSDQRDQDITDLVTKHGGRVLVCKARGIGSAPC